MGYNLDKERARVKKKKERIIFYYSKTKNSSYFVLVDQIQVNTLRPVYRW